MTETAIKGRSESELIQWLKDFADNLNSPLPPPPRLKTFNLELPYEEVFIRNGQVEVRAYTSRKRIQAMSREDAKTDLYLNISKACEEARVRKDITSYHVFSDKIHTWDRKANPNPHPGYKLVRSYSSNTS